MLMRCATADTRPSFAPSRCSCCRGRNALRAHAVQAVHGGRDDAELCRRTCLTYLTAPAVVAGAGSLLQPRAATATPLPTPTPASALLGPAPPVDDIYSRYPYRSPLDILRYVRDRAPVNSPQAVLDAIDEFSVAYPMYKIGPEKGAILDSVVRLVRPSLVVELGSFVGYSAVRIARLLPPGGAARVVCVEANPECVAALQGVLEHAGLRERVEVEAGLAGQVVGGLREKYGPAQLLFEDHCKPCYLPDLLLAESSGLVGPGSWVIADNVIYPGAPDLLEHLNGGEYASMVVPAAYEYDQPWNPSWEPKQDGMSVSVRLAGLAAEQSGAARAQLEAFVVAR